MPVSATAVARDVSIDLQHKNLRQGAILFLEQHIVVLAQGKTGTTYSTDKFQATSHKAVGDKLGYGSPAHLVAMQLHPSNGDGVGSIPVTYLPLVDAYGATAATWTITPSGTQTEDAEYRARVGGILSSAFTVLTTDTVATICTKLAAAINGVLEMPTDAVDNTTDVTGTIHWEGPSGNDIEIEIIGEALGVTFTIVQPAGGLVDPDITSALAQLAEDEWYTIGVNAVGQSTAILDELETWGEGRWTQNVPKPFCWFAGTTEAVVATATTIPEARKSDRVNGQLVAPGSPDAPFVVAARQIARIAPVATDNPPTGYGAETTDLIPGDDSEQWTYADRDTAVKAGSSTVVVKNGVVEIGEVVTFYHPDGEEPPAYRFLVNIVKLQNVSYNVDLRFGAKAWASAPLIPDNEATTNANARKPSSAKSEMSNVIDGLADAAIVSNRDEAKDNTTAAIDTNNPDRLNLTSPIKVSGNTRVKAITVEWGFNFGAAA